MVEKRIDIEKLKEKKSIKELLEFGIINIDKPEGMTSFDVSDFVRKKLKLRKTSHFGTLDPMVTGVLPVALNRACKLTGFFIGEDKEYIGTMRIHEEVPIEDIKKVIKEKFIGKIIQLPPVRSSVKRQEREREIKKFELLKQEGKNIFFIVECQGGTYIRKLVHDLGEEMGIGAHMTKLRRIRAGIFMEKEIIKKKEFEDAVDEYFRGDEEKLKKMIIPAEIISEVYPVIKIKGDNLNQILTGKPIHKKDVSSKEKLEENQIICIFANEQFIGMYKIVNEKEVLAKAMFVLQPLKE